MNRTDFIDIYELSSSDSDYHPDEDICSDSEEQEESEPENAYAEGKVSF